MTTPRPSSQAAQSPPSLRRVSAGVLAAGLLVMSAAGCVKAHADITVHPDDTISGVVIMGIDKQLAPMMGDTMSQVTSDWPEGTKVTDWSDSRYTGKKVVIPSESLQKFNAGENSTTQNNAPGDLQIRHNTDSGKYVLSGAMDLTDVNSGGDGEFDQMAASALATSDIRIRVTFPVSVETTNGKISDDGKTVTWHPTFGTNTRMSVVTESTNTPAWVVPVAAGGGGAVLLLLVVGGLVTRRRGRAPLDEVQPEAAVTS